MRPSCENEGMTEFQRVLATAPLGGLAAMARALKVSTASPSAWKLGKTTPGPRRLEAVAEYLGLPHSYFVVALSGERFEQLEPLWPVVRVDATVTPATIDVGGPGALTSIVHHAPPIPLRRQLCDPFGKPRHTSIMTSSCHALPRQTRRDPRPTRQK